MAGILDMLKRGGATALDLITPDQLFGNIGKVGHRAMQPLAGQVADVPPEQLGQVMPAQPQQPMIGQGVKNGFGILDRVLGGQTFTDAMEGQRVTQRARAQEPIIAARQAQTQQMFDTLAQEGKITPQEALLARTDPKSFAEMMVNRFKPVSVDDSSSVYTNGEFQQAPAAPVKAPLAPYGYRWTEDGANLEAIPGGPADITQVGALANTRQQAIARNRRPVQAKSGGTKASGPEPWSLKWNQ